MSGLNNLVSLALKEAMKSSRMSDDIVRSVQETVIGIVEDTTLRSLVAKADSKQKARESVLFLQKHGVNARSTFPAKFGLSSDERDGWGVFVEPGDVKAAADALAPIAKGLAFDPYVHSSEK